MRFMAWHLDYLNAIPTEKGRSDVIAEPLEIKVKNSLLLFISFEKDDSKNKVDIIDRAVGEIIRISGNVGVSTLVLNPFAHMFADLAPPAEANAMMVELRQRLADRNFEVLLMSFGYFYEMELKAKGHKLARISREIH